MFNDYANYQLVVTVVMKNCEPLVFFPAFAIDNSPANQVPLLFINFNAYFMLLFF